MDMTSSASCGIMTAAMMKPKSRNKETEMGSWETKLLQMPSPQTRAYSAKELAAYGRGKPKENRKLLQAT